MNLRRSKIRLALARGIANRLPHLIVYFAVIRLWVYVTTGEMADVPAPDVTISDALRILEKATFGVGN